MKNRVVIALVALCAVLIIIGGVFYMINTQKHQRVKDRYDSYMAALDAYVEKNGLPMLSEGDVASESEIAYDAIYEKAEEARAYLKEHAPHLLSPEKDSDASYSRQDYIEHLREHDPAAAADLEASLAQNKREYESAIAANEAQLASWQQELVDHQVQMAETAKSREASRRDRIRSEREGQQLRDRFHALYDKISSHLILDENNNIIGLVESSIFRDPPQNTETQLGAADVLSEPLDSPSIDPPDTSVDTDADVSLSPDDPRVWRETATGEMAGIHNGFYDQYSDVMIRSYLTDTEYQTLFPTEQARRDLQKRTDALQTAYATRIGKILEKTPSQRKSALIEIARDALSKEWDDDFVNTIISKVRQDKE